MTRLDPVTDENFRELRLGDSDRNAAIDSLSSHYVEGRLSLEEFDERSSGVMKALTFGELDPLFEGLPGGVPLVPDTAGHPVAKAVAVPAEDPERDLAELARKGKVMDKVDGIAFTLAAVFFFASIFFLHVPHAWLAWLAAFAVSLIGRAIVGFDDKDEEVWEEIKEKETAERSERLKIALERRRELEK